MSYHAWTVCGFGFCTDDIVTTPERIMRLVKQDARVMDNIRRELDAMYPNGWREDQLTMEDFDGMEGDYGESGVAFVLSQMMPVDASWCCDIEGRQYIILEPEYPWHMTEAHQKMTEDEVYGIFRKLIAELTDEAVDIDYLTIENGG